MGGSSAFDRYHIQREIKANKGKSKAYRLLAKGVMSWIHLTTRYLTRYYRTLYLYTSQGESKPGVVG